MIRDTIRRWLRERTPDRGLTLYDPDVAIVAMMNGRRVREPHEWQVHNCRCVLLPLQRGAGSSPSFESPFAAAGVVPAERPRSASATDGRSR